MAAVCRSLLCFAIFLMSQIVVDSSISPSRQCKTPPNFPQKVKVKTLSYQSYAKSWASSSILVANPTNAAEIVEIVNWAKTSNYQVRALGGNHNFSPFTISKEESISCPKTILVDTTLHLTSMKMQSEDSKSGTGTVFVESGAMLSDLLQYLEWMGYGVFASPSIGSISVGGMLATGTHGTGVRGGILDNFLPGQGFGSMSNLIVEMTIIGWDEESNSYKLKTVHRSHPDCKAFLIHLGRTFVTSVVLKVGQNQKLRMQSHFNIKRDEAFASPDIATVITNSLSKFVKIYGRVSCSIFPNSENLLITTKHAQEVRPIESREIIEPLNDIFINGPDFPSNLDDATIAAFANFPFLAAITGPLSYIGSNAFKSITMSKDTWGWSKNQFLIVPNTTPHMSIAGLAFLTSNRNLQKFLSLFHKIYSNLEAEYAAENKFPINGILEIRITEADNPSSVGVEGAEAPLLSPSRPSESYPDYNFVVRLDIGSFIGTPDRNQFLAQFQDKLYQEITPDIALIRPEWSKEWAYNQSGPFLNHDFLTSVVPSAFLFWNEAIETFNKFDPFKVFSNSFLNDFLVHRE